MVHQKLNAINTRDISFSVSYNERNLTTHDKNQITRCKDYIYKKNGRMYSLRPGKRNFKEVKF